MTRLAIVRQKYNPAGGAERFVSRALDALAQQATLDVTLITRRWETRAGWHSLKLNPFYLGNVWRDAGFARAVRHTLRQQPFDLVQSHERIAGCDVFRAGDGVHRDWLARRARALSPLGRLAMWLNPYHHYVCHAEARMFRHPALKAVICNSQMVAAEIHARFGLPHAQLPVIYNGVDTTAFHPDLAAQHRAATRQQWHIPPEAPTLLYVGSGFARKGVATALHTLARTPSVYLWVVGHDKHAARYLALAAQLGISDRVRFTGAQNEVKPFYGAADALILPTLYDPFPNVCVEALASGLPVLTSTGCGAAEWLGEGENGWVRDALDVEGFAAACADWLALRADWPQLRTAARATAEPYTLPRMAEALLTLYGQLLPPAAH